MKGRDIRSGTPKEIELTEKDACEAIMPILNQILGGIKEALENTPPELSADLIDMGLVLTGGGALLKNIDKLISQDTGLPVTIADDPLSCVAIGTGRALENEELFSTMLSNINLFLIIRCQLVEMIWYISFSSFTREPHKNFLYFL